jgi:hypothetical protein
MTEEKEMKKDLTLMAALTFDTRNVFYYEKVDKGGGA